MTKGSLISEDKIILKIQLPKVPDIEIVAFEGLDKTGRGGW